MALTLANAITAVRDVLNEDTAVFWSDAEITRWIQEGTRDFSTKSLLVEGDDTITLVANQLTYAVGDHAFIANVLEPYACFYNDGLNNYSGIIKVHPRVFGNEATNTAGKTKYYSFFNRKIWIWPVANATVVAAGATLKLLYAKETDDITALSDEMQQIPIIYARAMAKYKDKQFSEGNVYMSQYLNFVGFERQDKHGRESDTLDMFKISAKGGQGGAQ
jgi:hypothetical protein